MVAPGKSEKVKSTVYHEDEKIRGWRIVHQHLALDVDLPAQTLRGTATLSLRALNLNCFTIGVHVRRFHVTECNVNGINTDYKYHSALDDELLLEEVSNSRHPHRTEDVKRELDTQRTFSSDRGELVLSVPPEVTHDVSNKLLEAEREAREDPEFFELEDTPKAELHKLPVLTVTISYEIRNSAAGLTFHGRPGPAHYETNPQYMLTESRYGQVRTWMPCIDSLRWCDRYFFDLDVTVESSQVAVASGDLVTTRLLNPGSPEERKVYAYRNTVPTHAREIAVAVGPFGAYEDPDLPKTVTHFCLPGRAKELVHTSPPLFAKALAFCRDYFGFDPPCTSFRQLFVGPLGNDKHANRCAGGGLAILSGDLLHDSSNIDAGFRAREAIMGTLVQSYIGCLLRPRCAEDAWIIAGLAAHVTNLGLRSIFGFNWYRFRIMDEMEAHFTEKPEELVILSQVDRSVHVDVWTKKTLRRSLVVVYMIERRIGSDIMRRMLRDLVAEGRSVIVALSEQLDRCRRNDGLKGEKERESLHGFVMRAFSSTSNSLALSKPNTVGNKQEDEEASPGVSKRLGSSGAASGFDDGLLGISAGHFLKRLRAICGTDVRSLIRAWASIDEIPRVEFAYRYNARRHVVEFAVQQDFKDGINSKHRQALLFLGTINVRVMEVEGATEHPVDIRDVLHFAELHLMSRRTKKSSQAEKDPNYDPRYWTPISFVRIDPEQEWCMDVRLKQPENMLITMLQSERDAIGQFRACRELAGKSNPEVAKALAGVLEDDQVYWRVQAEAAKSLATCNGGLEALLAFCRSRYTDVGQDGRESVRRNDFSNFANYFVKRAIVQAIATAKEYKSGAFKRRILPEAVDFTMELLKGNDNAGNPYDDDDYVADLLRGAGRIAVESIDDMPMGRSKVGQVDKSFSTRAIQQIERYVALDGLIPGKTGAVTCALIRTLSEFEVAYLATMEKRGVGTPLQDLVRQCHQANETLWRLLRTHCVNEENLSVRLEALRAYALVYSGDLRILTWLLTRVDMYIPTQSTKELQIIDGWFKGINTVTETHKVEPFAVRMGVMNALNEAATTRLWGRNRAPILTALRRNTRRAKLICTRVRKLMVADVDDRIRAAACRFATVVWGHGAPVCFLGNMEYQEALNDAKVKGKNLQRTVVTRERRAAECPSIWPESNPKKSSKSSKNKTSSKSVKPAKTLAPPADTKPVVRLSTKSPSQGPKLAASYTSPFKIPTSKPMPPPPPPIKSRPIGKIVIPKAVPAATTSKVLQNKVSSSITSEIIGGDQSLTLSHKDKVASAKEPKISSLGKFGAGKESARESPTNEQFDIDDEDCSWVDKALRIEELEAGRNQQNNTHSSSKRSEMQVNGVSESVPVSQNGTSHSRGGSSSHRDGHRRVDENGKRIRTPEEEEERRRRKKKRKSKSEEDGGKSRKKKKRRKHREHRDRDQKEPREHRREHSEERDREREHRDYRVQEQVSR